MKSILKLLSLAFGKRIALTIDPVVGEATTTFALSSKLQASRMFLKGIMCCALVVACVSCKSHSVVQRGSTVVQDSSRSFNVASAVDTVLLRDSIYIREVQRGDTVYRDRVEYRDRWRVRLVHDTVHDTQYITKTIEHPPEKYVPKFYKWCTIALWAIGLSVIGYRLLRLYLRR